MAWRFKVSKYKNITPIFPKKEEFITDIPVGRLMQSCGNHIAASCSYMAFNTDTGGGGNIGILPLDSKGRQGQALPLLKAHADFVNDMCFSRFDDYLLATCSADHTVKIWSLPSEDSLASGIASLNHVTLPVQERKVENVLWHPTASGVLAVSVDHSLKVYDANTAADKYVMSCHDDTIQGFSWHGNGSVIATTCKDKKIRILDPRTNTVVEECSGHMLPRESRIAWLGDSDFILSTGFSEIRDREVKIWDSRKMSACLATETVDKLTGILMPLFDEDTNMLYLAGKADGRIGYYEVTTSSPYLVHNSAQPCDQLKGATLIPKRAVHVMDGEVDRLLLLVKNCIIPGRCIVLRRQYKDFHADVFPDTKSGEAALTADQWFAGQNGQLTKISLDPAKRSDKPVARVPPTVQKQSSPERPSNKQETLSAQATQVTVPDTHAEPTAPSKPAEHDIPVSAPKPSQIAARQTGSAGDTAQTPTSSSRDSGPIAKPKAFKTGHQSKCKYLKGTTEHKSKHIENIRRLCRTLPGESDLFYANKTRCAVPVEGSGGLLGIFELNKPGRLPDAGSPVLQNGYKVNDLAWDPFDDSRLVVACENARINVWKIPEGGLTETLTQPDSYMLGHTEKIYFVKFHPLAKDVILTSSYDMTLKLWDLADNTEKITITCHDDQVFCAEWSPDGKLIATVCKDGKLRIIDPRDKSSPVKQEGAGPDGSRGARVLWALNMKYLVISGFNRSHQCVYVYKVSDISQPISTHTLDNSSTILVPYYDEGTSTVFLTGRGDRTVSALELADEEPYLFLLSPVSFDSLHQGFAFMPKTTCDVRNVEFAKAWRLSQSSVEPVSFTVPRAKPEFFQDDLFPDAVKTDEPVLSSQEWFSGMNREPNKISLRPADMTPLSEAPVGAAKAKKYNSYNADTYKTDEQKKDELLGAITGKLELKDEPLPQDISEGVDSDEWGDD